MLEINVLGKCESNKLKTRQVTVWRAYDRLQLCETIEMYLPSWRFVEHAPVDDKMNWLLDILSLSTDQFKSKRTICTSDNFFDDELENMRVEKNRLYKMAQYAT